MKISMHKILLWLMYGSIIVDMLTGAILIKNPNAFFTPGIFYKVLVLMFLFYFMPKMNPVVFTLNSILFISSIFVSIVSGLSSFAVNLIAASKLLLYISFFYYLIYCAKLGNIRVTDLYKIALFTYIVICINQLLGIGGFGKPTYVYNNISIGTSGYFFEHNATGIILLIVSTVIYLYHRDRISKFKLFAFVGLTLIIGFSFATKVAIIGSLIIALIVFYDKLRRYFPLILVLLVVLVVINLEFILKLDQVSKVITDYNTHSAEGLLSGRSDRFAKGVQDYVERFTFFQQISGIGSYSQLNDPILGESAEIDFMDILKTTGLIGFFVVYIPFFFISFKLYRHYRIYKSKEFVIVLVLNIVFLIISSTAGHLFPSGSVNFYLALLNVYPFINLAYKKNNSRDRALDKIST